MKRYTRVIWILALAAGVAAAGVALTPSSGPSQTPLASAAVLAGAAITVYSSPTCSCCTEYEEYLSAHGLDVRSVKIENVAVVKNTYDLPPEAWSCHSSIIGGYIVEGHVPVEVIAQLLEERPRVDGIALPGMPAGSPGMSGRKDGVWTIFALSNGALSTYVRY